MQGLPCTVQGSLTLFLEIIYEPGGQHQAVTNKCFVEMTKMHKVHRAELTQEGTVLSQNHV